MTWHEPSPFAKGAAATFSVLVFVSLVVQSQWGCDSAPEPTEPTAAPVAAPAPKPATAPAAPANAPEAAKAPSAPASPVPPPAQPAAAEPAAPAAPGVDAKANAPKDRPKRAFLPSSKSGIIGWGRDEEPAVPTQQNTAPAQQNAAPTQRARNPEDAS